MTQVQQHPRSCAGASTTKACVQSGCAAMRLVSVFHWNKKTGAGFSG
jgi:hypothetical protein